MNRLYDHGRNGFLLGSVRWLTDTIKALAVTNLYVPDFVNDRYVTDVPAGEVLSTSQSLYDKTASAGIAGAAPTRFVAVLGQPIHAIVLFKDTGFDSTSTLLAFIDVASNLPISPEGADLLVQWPSGLIFKV